jgi:hypothetical protein
VGYARIVQPGAAVQARDVVFSGLFALTCFASGE